MSHMPISEDFEMEVYLEFSQTIAQMDKLLWGMKEKP